MLIPQYPHQHLRSNNVSLERFSSKHITTEYLSWLNNRNTMQFSNQRFKFHSLASCQEYLNSFERSNNLFFSIHEKLSSKQIGTITANLSLEHGVADVGMLIGHPFFKGKGFGKEAWTLLLGWLEKQPYVRKITAGTSCQNIGMIKIIEFSGMKFESRKIKHEIINAIPSDIYYYSKFTNWEIN